MRAFYYFDTYRGGDSKSWVLKIVRHTCYKWLASNRRAGVTSLEADLASGGEVATVAIHPEPLLESRSDLRRLNRLIEALPAEWREAIVLRELHELGYREIAEVTGVPIGTVMSRLHRARSQLLQAFAGEAPSGDLAGPEVGGASSVPKSSSGERYAA